MVVRFNTDDVTIHLASAGAGKTTTAMQVITEALKSYRPDEIAFVTYTRKGVETGVARALAVNKDLTPDDLMHFKTLHALCFREAHLARKNIITQSDIAQFNSELGFSLTMNDAFGHVTEDDRLLQRYDAERSGSKRGVFVDGNYDRFRYDRLVNAYKAFKEGHDLVDFYDCLLKYMEQGEPLQGVKIALIDECFAPDTKVRMGDGTVREIKDIKVGDFVMGVQGPVEVTEVHSGTDTMYDVLSMRGELLFSCNSKHLIRQYTGYITGEWRHAEDLVNDHTGVYIDCINYRCKKQHATYAMVQVVPSKQGQYVGITVNSDDHLFLLANGCVVHNCQDLTPLQWQVCMKAFSEAEKVICLGDDFQCLYTYNGAAPELLVEMASHYKTVKHEISYRLPRKVYEFSKGITDLIQEKVEKDYRPADDREGFVETLPDRNVLARLIRDDLKSHGVMPGRWYLLFRTNCFIADMAMVLEQFIVPYHTSKGFCIPARDLSKIERYYNYRKVGYGNEEAKQRFMEENKITDINDSFMHSELIPGKERYFYQDLVDTWGLETLKKMSTMTEPFCLLSTVHKVKGGEADYTAMFMDCTRVVSENITLNADEELRVLYVGCTRSREGLYLIPASGKYSLSKLIDIVKELNDA